MNRATRFAGLMGVLLVIGLSGVAWGNDGDPLLLGHDNVAETLTTLMGPREGALQVNGGVQVNGKLYASTLAPACSGIIRVPAGKASGLSGFTSGDCGTQPPGAALVATINGHAPRGVWVTSIKNIGIRDQPNIMVHLNVRTPIPLTVAYLGFEPQIVYPPPGP
jgi:hypothetical protein